VSGAERRRNPRLGIAIPVRVQGFLSDGGTWEEICNTDDVSAGGASFTIMRTVELGQVLHLSLNLPKRLRQYDLNDVSYRVYSLVRGITRKGEQSRVGVMFFGKFPPRGFHERPSARFLLPSDSQPGLNPQLMPRPAETSLEAGAASAAPAPAASDVPAAAPAAPPSAPTAEPPAPPSASSERRTHRRVDIFVNFTIQQVDEWGAVLQEELTVADNVSKGGARVMTSLDFMKGDTILVQEAGGGFATRAEIRDVRKGPDGIRRLHLRFLDRSTPDRMLKQG
jgi:PilZ domain